MSMLTAPAPAPAHAPAPRHQPGPARRPGPRPVERPEPRQRPDHLRVVRPDEQPSNRGLRRLTPRAGLFATAFLFIVLFAVAGAQSLLVQGQLRLDASEKRLAAEQARYQELRKDLAGMESPERIVAAAHAQGMVTPVDLVYLQPVDADLAEGAGSEVDTIVQGNRDWSSVKPLLETPEP
jgi:hypothetical protein